MIRGVNIHQLRRQEEYVTGLKIPKQG